jgi:uncharacterized protein
MIHLFKFKDQYIVLDVNSGAIHLVTPIVYDILYFFEDLDIDMWIEKKSVLSEALASKYDKEAVLEAISEIDELIEGGMLFTDDSQVTLDMLENRDAVIKAMCLHVAHDCNMRCEYCFADEGAFAGERSKLSFETGKMAIDFLLKESGSRRNLEIDFFGGEPLMNFDVVRDLVAYGRQEEQKYNKNIRFTITTNGMLLDEDKEKFINENMDNVILSIDGRPQVNDRMRKTVGGDGTYERIIKNYKRLADNREGLYYVRGTFTGYNLDFVEDVKHLAEVGFANVSVEPVVTDESMEYAIRDEHIPAILNEYDKLADLYLDYAKDGRKFAFFHFNMDLNQGPCVIKRVSGCGAGTEYVAVSPEGDIYPCHQFVGEDSFKFGQIYDQEFNNHLYDTFNRNHIYNKPDCMECWAKFYCSGGCHANAYHANGDLLTPYNIGCEMERKRVENAIGIQAVLADQ